MNSREKAVFIDRDGVLNESPGDKYYVKSVKDFKFIPRAVDGVRALKRSGYRVVIVSNQSGVGSGAMRSADLDTITDHFVRRMKDEGAEPDRVYYCTHGVAEGCACRKPKPGLFERAVRELGIDTRRSFAVGDAERDLIPGLSLGCRTLLVLSGKTKRDDVKAWSLKPDGIVADLWEASQWILNTR